MPITDFCVLINLSCGVLVYNVGKSYVETDLAPIRLLSLFKVSINFESPKMS